MPGIQRIIDIHYPLTVSFHLSVLQITIVGDVIIDIYLLCLLHSLLHNKLQVNNF